MMKAMMFSAVAALVSFSGQASAQVGYNQVFVPGAGFVVNNGGSFTPATNVYSTAYYNPYLASGGQQRLYTDVYGNQVASRSAYSPGGFLTESRFVQPYAGVQGQQGSYADGFGNRSGQSYLYNPFTGQGYTSGYYQPGPFGNPLSGYSYGYNFRR